jgi:hypothetical protein
LHSVWAVISESAFESGEYKSHTLRKMLKRFLRGFVQLVIKLHPCAEFSPRATFCAPQVRHFEHVSIERPNSDSLADKFRRFFCEVTVCHFSDGLRLCGRRCLRDDQAFTDQHRQNNQARFHSQPPGGWPTLRAPLSHCAHAGMGDVYSGRMIALRNVSLHGRCSCAGMRICGCGTLCAVCKGCGFGPCPLKNLLEPHLTQPSTWNCRRSELPAPT